MVDQDRGMPSRIGRPGTASDLTGLEQEKNLSHVSSAVILADGDAGPGAGR
jgi:hypothetical protein